MKSFVALIFSILICFKLFLISRVEPSPVYFACQNTTFAPNSLYQSNLNDLLGQLSSRATTGDYFYQNRSGSSDNTVYGSYFCLNYVSIDTCSSCVATAAKEAPKVCPSGKQVLIWYELCMLRYANQSFFFTLETQPTLYQPNVRNALNPSKFAEALAEVMSDFVTQAENGAKSFLTTSINISGFQTMYSLMQCTPDLSGADCTRCLKNAIASLPTCCLGKLGGRVLSPSCYIRFEVYLFYNGSSTSSAPPPGNGSRISGPAIAAIVIAVTIASLALGFCLLRRRRLIKMKQYDVVRPENGIDSLQFELVTIETATKNFSQDYKLGEGGFGEVYKGIFASGQEIAVKRLSKSSGQGTEEFKNEVALVAKLQHRNLVRLLGFCLGGGETILVYEFVPNKSLDYFLFDPEKRRLLDWSTRSKIVGGICRGILYLHEDSRLRVIHRDLKASNVLLDGDMNPKISDFGMARMVGIDQTQGNTKRIVGTYGYMAPEYAMEGLYSVKSDVFSFGVLLLEILSGKKNSGFHLTKFAPSLLAFAWQLWNEERGIELMDQFLKHSCPPNEFFRYVHIGLLCVQEDAYNRPTMSTILLMLTSETTSLPKPKRPAFFVGRLASDNNQELGVNGCSDNGLTISNFVPR